MPVIKVEYGASSNISYRGTWDIEIDDEEWEDATPSERNDMINELAQEKLLEDVEWNWKD